MVGYLSDWRYKLEARRSRLDTEITDATAAGREVRAELRRSERRDLDDLSDFIESTAMALEAVDAAKGWHDRAEAATQLLHQLLGKPQVRGWWPEHETAAFEAVESALERLAQLDEIDPEPSTAVFLRALSTELSVACLLYTSPSPRDATLSRMPSSA